ncbi:MAG: ATP synthase F1 subunit gamma [Ignavibacteria bacterium]|nr:ATP synthase F1 subunit gamma [Ignavibacteria bacterium]
MATLREVRNRITGVKKTQKITKAMKMVAAAKLRRAQSGVIAARPYAATMKNLLSQLVRSVDTSVNPLLAARDARSIAVIVVTSDRGLCGGFNANLIRTTLQHLGEKYPGVQEEGRLKLFCVGKKGCDFFSKRQYTIAGKYVDVYSDLVFTQAQAISREVVDGFLKGEIDVVEIVYNEFQSVARQNVVFERFLPIQTEIEAVEDAKTVDYLYEPSTVEIVDALLPRHLNFHIWKALLESNAAEQGARMAAMENATENANEMISHLQLVYNKARQAAITKELLELVGGAEALKKAG